MILLVKGDEGFCVDATAATSTGAAGSLLFTSSESSSKRLVNEKELLVFCLFDEVLDMDSGSWSDFDKLLLRLLLCDKELIKSSRSRRSASSESEGKSEPLSFDEMLEVMDEDCEMLSMSLSRISSLSTNSSDEV